MSIFFSSDFHLGHSNIIKYCKRPFKDVLEMNNTIINNFNTKLNINDILFHLGDFSFKNSKTYNLLFSGIKIIHIKGNHDDFHALEFAVIKDVLLVLKWSIKENAILVELCK
jgi:calcineurin-like phosphoesterase family protein